MSPLRLYLYNLIVRLLPETRFFRFKAAFLRWCGAKVGQNVRICSSAKIQGNGALEIGDDVWIGSQMLLISTSKIQIGSHIDIAPQVLMLTGSHELDHTGEHVAGRGISLDVQINDGVWLGASAKILPGVTIERGTMVAAGSVVTRNQPSHALVAGVPAVVKKSWQPEETK
ncbi:MAG: acyltransferase [Thermoguttaceae bacterium]|nr:acyltransferase [Thermoguttaceae bacterium]